MPHTDRQRRPGTAGTVALLVGSALLACLGLLLLAHDPSSAPRTTGTSTTAPRRESTPAASTPARSSPTSPADASASPAPAKGEGAPSPAAVPNDITAAARHFVLAWSGHDARPGKDSSYDDAAHRAAAYSSRDLAEQLTTNSAGSARQWQQWTRTKAVVAAEISQISVPDGAPEPTADTAWIRVRYRLTTTPATGRPSSTDEQVALKLQRDQAGTWLVTALPYV
ncbi:hypothetical protein MHW47_06180 [Streptomyces sp. OfavH-34-F]|uniref:hypothetical protein n=1 Tax=Streptomyces sp. OfavH-34-F TaxID=2917760 RepID=UPI001EF1CF5B|nr:hypothetical protein [Streptomyces sp. OfavH-34-F]MCG7524030.1 hypothetical protein [Streptomyces sp. OfavH-34-F]